MEVQTPDQEQARDFYTWRAFKKAVLDLCPNDARRLGMENYLPRLIREGVIDLMQFLPNYQKRHETLYYPQDFAQEGEASVGTFPPKSDIQSIWIFDVNRHFRFPVHPYPWERRFSLVHRHRREFDNCFDNLVTLTAASVQAIELINRLPVINATNEHRHGLYAVDPQHETFYMAPHIRPDWLLSVHWHGKKLDYKDDELVPFDEEATFAVASWVSSKVALQVDRDAARAKEFMNDYVLARTNLYIDIQNRGNTDQK